MAQFVEFDPVVIRGQPVKKKPSAPRGPVFWGDDPEAWDTVVLAGKRLPGQVEISGQAYKQKLDKKQPAGQSGATLSKLGREPAEFDIHLKLWESQHLSDFADVVRLIKPKAVAAPTKPKFQSTEDSPGTQDEGTKAALAKIRSDATATYQKQVKAAHRRESQAGNSAVDISHPALALYGIRKVVIIQAGVPKKQKDQVYEVTLKAVEYVRPVAVGVNTVSKSQSGGSSTSITSLGPGALVRKPSQTQGGP